MPYPENMTADEAEQLAVSLTESAKEKLRQFVSKIENVEKELDELRADRSSIYADAKALGFDTKALRAVIARRKKDRKALQEAEMMLDLYLHALGEL